MLNTDVRLALAWPPLITGGTVKFLADCPSFTKKGGGAFTGVTTFVASDFLSIGASHEDSCNDGDIGEVGEEGANTSLFFFVLVPRYLHSINKPTRQTGRRTVRPIHHRVK